MKIEMNTKNNVVVWDVENFITNEEAQEILRVAKNKFEEVTVLGEPVAGYRVAQGAWISDEESAVVSSIKHKISNLVNLPKENFEQFHVVRYDVGGQYKTHHDYFYLPRDEEAFSQGGQRVFSALFYLNDDFEGGETDFPKINYRVVPQKNKLLLWRNVDESKKVIEDSLHAGLPVMSGVKYIGIFWIREKKFF